MTTQLILIGFLFFAVIFLIVLTTVLRKKGKAKMVRVLTVSYIILGHIAMIGLYANFFVPEWYFKKMIVGILLLGLLGVISARNTWMKKGVFSGRKLRKFFRISAVFFLMLTEIVLLGLVKMDYPNPEKLIIRSEIIPGNPNAIYIFSAPPPFLFSKPGCAIYVRNSKFPVMHYVTGYNKVELGSLKQKGDTAFIHFKSTGIIGNHPDIDLIIELKSMKITDTKYLY